MPRRTKTPRTRQPAPTGVGISELLAAAETCEAVAEIITRRSFATPLEAMPDRSRLNGERIALWDAAVILRREENAANGGTHRREAAAGDVEMQTRAATAASRSVQ